MVEFFVLRYDNEIKSGKPLEDFGQFTTLFGAYFQAC